MLWKAYDVFFKPVFGDGERTMEETETQTETFKMISRIGSRRRKSRTAMMVGDVGAVEECEKKRLLGDW